LLLLIWGMKRGRIGEGGYTGKEDAGARGGISIIAIDEMKQGGGRGSALLAAAARLLGSGGGALPLRRASLWVVFEAGFWRLGFGRARHWFWSGLLAS
jgi:GNAT superfamily N-acetyltransferase